MPHKDLGSIRRAARIASDIAEKLPSILVPGITEKEVASWIRKEIKAAGGEGESFRIIVSSGKRSSLVHGYATMKVIRKREQVLVDFGVRCGEMRSDISRTYFVGPADKKQRNIYNTVLSAQNAAINKVRAGMHVSKVDLAARDLLRSKGYSKEFPHSTGHGIGKRVHQSPRISWKSGDILKAGDVITIEPGIYIKGWGGVRIEDMLIVTRTGHSMLTKASK